MIITKKARLFINELYDNFNKTGEWYGAATLRVKVGPELVDKLSKKYDPLLFVKMPDNTSAHYELTMQGIFESANSTPDRELLYRFLSFLKERYVQDPESRYINASVVRDEFQLQQDKLDRLRTLVAILFTRNSKSIQGADWNLQIPWDFELLIKGMSVEQYVEHQIEQNYQLDRSYRATQRPRVNKYLLGFWLLLFTQAWSVVVFLRVYLPRALPYATSGASWITLIVVVGLLKLFGKELPHLSQSKVAEKSLWLVISLVLSVLAGWFSGC